MVHSPSTPLRTPVPHLIALLLAALIFVGSGALWMASDRLVPDGDESGHIGAAELFRDDLNQGTPLAFARRLMIEDMGEYPSLVPAVTGAWWFVTGQGDPASFPVQIINLGWLLLAAGASFSLARRLGADAPALVASLVLFVPICAGLSRHFMPEGALVAAVALALAAAARQREGGWTDAILLGLALSMGLLVKQTFGLYVLMPLLFLVRPGVPLLGGVLVGLLPALIWYGLHADAQWAYLSASAGYATEASQSDQLLYYPRALAGPALGPLWVMAAIPALVQAWTPKRRLVLVAIAWLVGGVVLLSLIPKRYDRLLAPLLPALPLLLGATAKHWMWAIGAGLAAVTLGASFWGPVVPDHNAGFHPGCAQVWLRVPIDDDLGISAVVDAARGKPSVEVIGAPEIPCALQTTHGWTQHLEPALRRGGVEAVLVPERGAIVVEWEGGEGERIEVPALESWFMIRTPNH